MPSPISSILRQLSKPKEINILTFPFDYVFDSYWDNIDANIFLWCYRAERYPNNFLPKNCTIIDSELIPIDVDLDLIITHENRSYLIGRQLANFYHIPLCHWKHSFEYPGGRYNLEVVTNPEMSNVGAVLNHATDNIEIGNKSKFLVRREVFNNLAGFIPPSRLEPLSEDFHKRHHQYGEAVALVNLNSSYNMPEIEECKSHNIPVISVETPYHKGIAQFKEDEECRKLLINPPQVELTQGKMIKDFSSDIENIYRSLGEYIHEPI